MAAFLVALRAGTAGISHPPSLAKSSRASIITFMSRPLIGITVRSHAADPGRRTPFGYYLPAAHVSAVEAAGGDAVLLPHGSGAATTVCARLDGLVLSGGADIAPAHYAQPLHPQTFGVDTERDGYEIALVRAAVERGLPLLAICRGIQVMNVALGGTLLQHVPDRAGTEVCHRAERASAPPPTHEVRVQPASRLATAMQSELVRVNSYHHQAVDQPGHEVQVVAWAPDDIVEGIELPDHPFALGVQWHPERIFWHDRTQFALFRALVRAGQTRERDDVRRET